VSEIATSTLEIARQLAPAANAEISVRQILANEIRRRMNRYELTDRCFHRKYGMSFYEFRDQRIVEKQGYGFEVESDYCDWEMAVTGLAALKDQLAQVGTEENA
jgi:hypothetical protein